MDLSSAAWRKSSRSSEQGDACIEMAYVPGTIAIRDSKDPLGPALLVNRREFQQLASVLKNL